MIDPKPNREPTVNHQTALTFIVFAILIATTGCQQNATSPPGDSTAKNNNSRQDESNASPSIENRQVANLVTEASCGQCQLGLEGKGCDLAVRIDGKAYYVDGSDLDSHGDAHGKDGLCNCIRKAEVTGELKDGRFIASSFKLLPLDNDEE